MSGIIVGSKEHLAQRGIRAWATVPLEYIDREMAPDRSTESRLKHAMIRWSWCGPEATEYVALKDDRNRLVLDRNNQPIPARQSDLARFLGIGKSRVAHLIKKFVRQGSVLFDADPRRMYLMYKPSAFDPQSEKVVSTGNFSIAGIVVSTDNLPSERVARTEAFKFLEERSTEWKNDLKSVKTRHRELLRQGLFERGILIDKRNSLRQERSSSSSDRSSVMANEEVPEARTTMKKVRSIAAGDQPSLAESIWRFACENTVRKTFTRGDVAEYLSTCRHAANERGEILSDHDVLAIMQNTLDAAGGIIESFSYYVKAAVQQTNAYLDHRSEPRARAANAGSDRGDGYLRRLFGD
jgi:hypothetical protein